MRRPRALTIAGLDPTAGAGLAADLRVFEAWRCDGAAVAAAVTAQGSRGVEGTWAAGDGAVAAQLRGLAGDGLPASAKTGMLLTADAVRAVAAAWSGEWRRVPLVVDPVLASSGGVALLEDAARLVLIRDLLPHAALVTPNAPEAEALAGPPVREVDGAVTACRRLLALGARAVLVKGGHLPGDDVVDVLLESGPGDPVVFRRPRVAHGGGPLGARRVRGTGCALSAAIAAGLAHGMPPRRAVEIAGDYVHAALRGAFESGPGALRLDHGVRVPGMP